MARTLTAAAFGLALLGSLLLACAGCGSDSMHSADLEYVDREVDEVRGRVDKLAEKCRNEFFSTNRMVNEHIDAFQAELEQLNNRVRELEKCCHLREPTPANEHSVVKPQAECIDGLPRCVPGFRITGDYKDMTEQEIREANRKFSRHLEKR